MKASPRFLVAPAAREAESSSRRAAFPEPVLGRLRGAGVVALLAASSWLVGCGDAFEAASTDASSSSSGGQVTPTGCVPSNLDAGTSLESACGVFVDASGGADDGDGTPDQPLRSLGKALERAAGKAIYVCAASDAAVAGATLEANQDIFGGLDCSTWTYSAEQSAVLGPADLPALRVSAGIALRLEDLALTAPTAIAPGASSIALLSEGDVTLARVRLAAGDGAQGIEGDAGGEMLVTLESMDGTDGAAAKMAPGEAASGANDCQGVGLIGGAGGLGGNKAMSNKNGGDGVPGDVELAPDTGGAPGDGQVVNDNSWQCVAGEGSAFPGTDGEPGSAGEPGGGLGALGPTGVQGRDGADGLPASNGKSGGGGGGSAAASTNHGAGGGGGGAGGCAGKFGRGGGAGGSSLPVLALAGSLKLDEVKLVVGAAGKGGKGGNGQLGQVGGAGGLGGGINGTTLKGGCGGGNGGRGGHGGDAGGGAGGHAIGLAQAADVAVDGAPDVDLGDVQPAQGGPGGDATDKPADAGAEGLVVETQAF